MSKKQEPQSNAQGSSRIVDVTPDEPVGFVFVGINGLVKDRAKQQQGKQDLQKENQDK